MFRFRLKELRENMGLSQYTFAEQIGIAQSTVGGWEAGKREPNFSTILKIADFFGVTVDYLLGRDKANKKEAPRKAEPGLEIFTTEELEMIADFRELSAESQRCVSFLIQKLQIAEKVKHPASDIRHFDAQDSTVG